MAAIQGKQFEAGTTVIINLGINDFIQQVEHRTTENNLVAIVDQLGPNVNVVLSAAPDFKGWNDLQAKRNDDVSDSLSIPDFYQNVAEKFANVTIVDAVATLLESPQDMYEDGVHTDASGQANQFAQLQEILAKTPEFQSMPEEDRNSEMVRVTQEHIIKYPDTWVADLEKLTSAHEAAKEVVPELHEEVDSNPYFSEPAPGATLI